MNIPISELKEALAKASPGPWTPFLDNMVESDGEATLRADLFHDAILYALLRNNADALIAAAERVERMEKALNDIRLECSREDGEFQTVDVIALKALDQSEG